MPHQYGHLTDPKIAVLFSSALLTIISKLTRVVIPSILLSGAYSCLDTLSRYLFEAVPGA